MILRSTLYWFNSAELCSLEQLFQRSAAPQGIAQQSR